MSDNSVPDRRIFIVAPSGLYDSAGIGRLVTSLTRHWREKGGPGFQVIDPYGPARLLLTPLYLMRAMLQIFRHAMAGRIRLLHVHMATRGSIVRKTIIMRLAQRLRLPIVLHLHGEQFDGFYRALPGLVRRAVCATMRNADAVVVLGECRRDIVADETGIDPRRIRVVYNGVCGPETRPLRNPDGHCRILFLGRLEAAKGVPELIAALADKRLAALDWRARLAGAGDVAGCSELIAAAGLSGRIEVRGWAAEAQVRRWLAESDVFVLPSHAEGMSMAVLEAMAFGLAVITTPVGANAEAIADGRSGILIPAGSRGDLIEALCRVIDDRELRRNLQIEARRAFEQRFDIGAHSRQLETLYAEIGGSALS
jgi:glycosyltransferase involved in cell wall biosynthesis